MTLRGDQNYLFLKKVVDGQHREIYEVYDLLKIRLRADAHPGASLVSVMNVPSAQVHSGSA